MPCSRLQVRQQVQDLRLDGDVERRRRLVGDQQLRLAGERHRDHHALAHAAGELVRIVVEALRCGSGMPTRSSSSIARAARLAPRQPAMQAQRLGDLRADRQHRIERRHRLLEDHGDAVAADRGHRALVEAARDRGPRSGWRRASPGPVLQEAHDGQCGDALAAAALAHQRHRLVGVDGEAHAVDDRRRVAGRPEGDGEILNFQERHRRRCCPGFHRLECTNDHTFGHCPLLWRSLSFRQGATGEQAMLGPLGEEFSTFAISARCPETGKFGVAISTRPIGVGSRCPFIRPGLGVVVTMAVTDPRLGPLGLRLLDLGYSSTRVLAEIAASDPHIEHRQISVIDRDGNACRPHRRREPRLVGPYLRAQHGGHGQRPDLRAHRLGDGRDLPQDEGGRSREPSDVGARSRPRCRRPAWRPAFRRAGASTAPTNIRWSTCASTSMSSRSASFAGCSISIGRRSNTTKRRPWQPTALGVVEDWVEARAKEKAKRKAS